MLFLFTCVNKGNLVTSERTEDAKLSSDQLFPVSTISLFVMNCTITVITITYQMMLFSFFAMPCFLC